MEDILSLTKEELCAAVTEMGEKSFRAKQIYEWLHFKKVADFSQMSNISAQFRDELSKKLDTIEIGNSINIEMNFKKNFV